VLTSPGQRILLVVGRTCAGKSTMGAHLAQEHGAYFVEASAVVRHLLGRRPEDPPGSPPPDLDYALIAHAIVDIVQACDRPLVVVSGLRTLCEYRVLTAHVPQAELVNLTASPWLRFHRCRARLREDAAESRGTFRRLDSNPEHTLLPAAAGLARFAVRNEGSIQDLWAAADAIVEWAALPAATASSATASSATAGG
jgi:dephospho-CoA kinase